MLSYIPEDLTSHFLKNRKDIKMVVISCHISAIILTPILFLIMISTYLESKSCKVAGSTSYKCILTDPECEFNVFSCWVNSKQPTRNMILI